MARRKKVHHRRRRSHRIGAVNLKQTGTKILGVAAGAFVARTLYNMLQKSAPTIPAQYIGLGTVVLGAFVPKFIKSSIGEGVGDGLIAIGAITAMQNFGLISGIGAVPARRVPSRLVRMGASSQPFLTKTVGAVTRPYMSQMVGSAYAMQQEMNRQALGSLYVED